jgi:recombination protein RecR
MNYPKSIRELIEIFARFPSVGPKTAERYVSFLLSQPKTKLSEIAEAIKNLKDNLKICQNCFNISETDPCPICAQTNRDKKLLCIVADGRNINLIERTGDYNGLYFILGGELNTIEGTRPEDLNIKKLIERIKNNNISEVILALNPTMEGETTVMYLAKLLKQINPKIKTTKLARGLPAGAELEYADELTLSHAFKHRTDQ